MAKLLYIEASPRKERSLSIAVANHFLARYRKANPEHAVETIDLWAFPLPEFDGYTIDAKYKIMHGLEHSPEEAEAWEHISKIFDRFNDADKYLFSLPMWNFGIPYKLKHFIDIITQPGLSFSFSPETGYTGLVSGKPAVTIYARGGEYSSNDAVRSMDFQKTYFDNSLKFIGFTDIRTILVEPGLADPESVEKTMAAAKAEAEKIADRF